MVKKIKISIKKFKNINKGILENISNLLYRELLRKTSKENLLIDNIILGASFFRKTNYSKVLGDMSFYLVILNRGESGFAYFNTNSKEIENSKKLLRMINKNVLEEAKYIKNLPLKVALIDAALGIYNKLIGVKPSKIVKARGSYQTKANIRAKILTKNIKYKEKVLLVGAVSEIAREILSKHCKLKITELSNNKKNTYLYNIPIEIGNKKTLEYIKKVDTAIITGATFSSGTIDKILNYGKKFGTKMIFYIETANNFGSYLIKEGVHTVVAEKFPFYDMPGTTYMEIYQSK